MTKHIFVPLGTELAKLALQLIRHSLLLCICVIALILDAHGRVTLDKPDLLKLAPYFCKKHNEFPSHAIGKKSPARIATWT